MIHGTDFDTRATTQFMVRYGYSSPKLFLPAKLWIEPKYCHTFNSVKGCFIKLILWKVGHNNFINLLKKAFQGMVGIFRKNKIKKPLRQKWACWCKLVGRYKHHNAPNESKEILLKLVCIVTNLMIQAYFTVEKFTVYLESLDNNSVYVSPQIAFFVLFFLEIPYPILWFEFRNFV